MSFCISPATCPDDHGMARCPGCDNLAVLDEDGTCVHCRLCDWCGRVLPKDSGAESVKERVWACAQCLADKLDGRRVKLKTFDQWIKDMNSIKEEAS